MCPKYNESSEKRHKNEVHPPEQKGAGVSGSAPVVYVAGKDYLSELRQVLAGMPQPHPGKTLDLQSIATVFSGQFAAFMSERLAEELNVALAWIWKQPGLLECMIELYAKSDAYKVYNKVIGCYCQDLSKTSFPNGELPVALQDKERLLAFRIMLCKARKIDVSNVVGAVRVMYAGFGRETYVEHVLWTMLDQTSHSGGVAKEIVCLSPDHVAAACERYAMDDWFCQRPGLLSFMMEQACTGAAKYDGYVNLLRGAIDRFKSSAQSPLSKQWGEMLLDAVCQLQSTASLQDVVRDVICADLCHGVPGGFEINRLLVRYMNRPSNQARSVPEWREPIALIARALSAIAYGELSKFPEGKLWLRKHCVALFTSRVQMVYQPGHGADLYDEEKQKPILDYMERLLSDKNEEGSPNLDKLDNKREWCCVFGLWVAYYAKLLDHSIGRQDAAVCVVEQRPGIFASMCSSEWGSQWIWEKPELLEKIATFVNDEDLGEDIKLKCSDVMAGCINAYSSEGCFLWGEVEVVRNGVRLFDGDADIGQRRRLIRFRRLLGCVDALTDRQQFSKNLLARLKKEVQPVEWYDLVKEVFDMHQGLVSHDPKLVVGLLTDDRDIKRWLWLFESGSLLDKAIEYCCNEGSDAECYVDLFAGYVDDFLIFCSKADTKSIADVQADIARMYAYASKLMRNGHELMSEKITALKAVCGSRGVAIPGCRDLKAVSIGALPAISSKEANPPCSSEGGAPAMVL